MMNYVVISTEQLILCTSVPIKLKFSVLTMDFTLPLTCE